MKGILRLVLALAALTIVPNAFAADTDGGNYFVDAKYGEISNSSDWGDTGPSTQVHASWGVGGGYLWKRDDVSSLGLELGYMHFGDISDGNDANGFTTETTSANAMTAGLHYEYLFGADEAWVFHAHAGLMRAVLDTTQTFEMGSPPSTFSSSSRENGVYLGAGIGRQVTQNFSLVLAYDLYDTKITQGQSSSSIQLAADWIGLEAEYRF